MTPISSPDDSKSDLDFGPTLRGFVVNQRVFDRYVLREIMGRGGMGVVWRAYDEQLECEVALKFLPEMVAFDEQAIAGLKRETRKTRELRHHHIVQVYDFVTDKRSACISMECVDGPTLSAIKARKESGCLEVDEITEWVKQLCEALSYAHERVKIVHRDLKPANLMINGKSELKVTDFGIARSVSDSVSLLTMTRGISGTLVYMSPQQLDGERASHLDDIYSLGATLYELLTSRPPFYSGGIERQIHEKTPPPLAQRREELGITSDKLFEPHWEETIAACLAKNPAQRPQSAGEVAHRLELGEDFTPSRKQEDPAQPEIGREPFKAGLGRGKRALVAALVTLLMTGIFAGWWFAFERPRKESKRQWQITVQREKEEQNKEAARRQEMAEQDRLAQERKRTAEAELEKERLAAAQRPKQEEEKKKEGSMKPIASAPDNGITSSATCPPIITHCANQAITPLNSVSCNNGVGHTNNSYWRAFNIGTFAGGAQYNVTSVSFGVEEATGAGGTQPVTVRLYTTTNFSVGFPGSLTQIATTTVQVPDAASGTVLSVPLVATVPAGTSELVMELFTPDGQAAGNLFFVGSNAAPATGPSYLSAAGCGITTPTTTAAIGFPNMHVVFNVLGGCVPGGTPTPTSPTPTPTFTPTPTPSPTASATAFDKSAVEAKLIELENKWEASYTSHDPSFAEAHIADDYRGVSSKGTVMSKSDLIAHMKKDTDIYESATNTDVKVQVHGPTMAVVTGVSHEKGRSKAGKAFNRRFRWTDTWIERDGRWQCTASQAMILQ